MAAQSPTRLHQFLGLVMWGDLGPLTMYRSHRGKLVIFQKTWPDTPPTPRQIAARDGMMLCGQSWRGLGADKRADWMQMARTLSLPGTGYNCWVSWRFKQDVDALKTLQHQSWRMLESSAHTPHVYDPRWRPIKTRRKDSYPDPGIFFMPKYSSVAAFHATTIWVMPWWSDLPYWAPIPGYAVIHGPGTLDFAPFHNRSFSPIWFTAGAAGTELHIHVTAVFPDGPTILLPLHIQVSAEIT